MKKLFVLMAVAGTLAFASCGNGEATDNAVDSAAIQDSINKAQAIADSINAAADTTTVKADSSVVK
jgi:ketopantoate reductase